MILLQVSPPWRAWREAAIPCWNRVAAAKTATVEKNLKVCILDSVAQTGGEVELKLKSETGMLLYFSER